jgi:fatty acid-binding protein DegV
MAGVHIVVDSATALPRSAAQDLTVTIVTDNASVDGLPFHGTDLADAVFFDALRSAADKPVIHSPSPDDYHEVFQRVLGWGVDVISLHPPRDLSDSAAAARAAAARLPADAPLSIVETAWPASALGLIAVHAAQAGIDDWPRTEVLGLIDAIEARLHCVGVSGDPAYLRRFKLPIFSSVEGTVGSVENPDPADPAAPGQDDQPDLRVVFECRAGVIRALARVPDIGEALRRLVAEVSARVEAGGALHLGAFSVGADAETAAVATFLESRHQPAEIWIAPCDPVTAIAVGPGAFGVAFFSD